MYSLVFMATMATAPEAEGFGGSWYNTCTLDSCLPIRYGWKPYGCVLNTPIHVPYGCCGCTGYGYGYGWHHGGCYGCYGAGCYGYGLGYWYDASSYGAGYHGFGAYGNYGNFGAYSLYPSGASTLGLNLLPTTSTTGSSLGNTILGPSSFVPTMSPGFGSPSNTTPGSILPSPYDPLSPRKESRLVPTEKQTVTAQIVIDVPENATVYIDNNKMKSGSGRRVFTTPPIEKGEEYFYTVRVVMDENGKKIEDTQKVTVRGGEDATASFAHLKRTAPALVGR